MLFFAIALEKFTEAVQKCSLNPDVVINFNVFLLLAQNHCEKSIIGIYMTVASKSSYITYRILLNFLLSWARLFKASLA